MWSCTDCENSFQTETGLKIHRTKKHSQYPNSTTAAKPTKPLFQSDVAMTTARPSSCKTSRAANNEVKAVTETQRKAKQNTQHDDDEDDVTPNDPAAICSIYGKQNKNERGLKQHMSRSHGVSSSTSAAAATSSNHCAAPCVLTCEVCGMQCKSPAGLKRHQSSARCQGTQASGVHSASVTDSCKKKPIKSTKYQKDSLQMSNERKTVASSVSHVESKAKTKVEQNQATESKKNKAGNVRVKKNKVKVRVERSNPTPSFSEIQHTCESEDSDEDDFSRKMFDLPVQVDADDLKPKRNQTQDVSNAVNEKITSLRSTLNGKASQSLLTWEPLNAGSKYEMTKIPKPVECDVMFTCRMSGVVVEQSEVPGFYRARWTIAVPDKFSCLKATRDKQQFVDPKLFLQHFRDTVNYCNRTRILEIDDVQKETSPGVKAVIEVTNYTTDPGLKTYCDVDLTPCIEFDGWPLEGRTDRPSWIPAGIWKQACTRFHLVPKPHHSEQATAPGQCTLWRVSFSYAEKTVLRAADYSANEGNAQTCRKDLNRQLKHDLELWRTEHKDDVIPDISSYIMKMIALRMYDKYPAPSCWSEDKLLDMHLKALRDLHNCCSSDGDSKPWLKHYFLPTYNVLDHLLLTANRRKQCKIVCQKCKDTIEALEKKRTSGTQ